MLHSYVKTHYTKPLIVRQKCLSASSWCLKSYKRILKQNFSLYRLLSEYTVNGYLGIKIHDWVLKTTTATTTTTVGHTCRWKYRWGCCWREKVRKFWRRKESGKGRPRPTTSPSRPMRSPTASSRTSPDIERRNKFTFNYFELS